MAQMESLTTTKTYMGKLTHGADLIEELTEFCLVHNIRCARIEVIGAVQQARLGFYDQTTKVYEFFDIPNPLEITHCIGNVSLKDGTPIVHAHVTLAGHDGKAYGGHLAKGTTIFACECIIQVFDGPDFVRGYDEITGLPLWDMDATR